VVSRKGDLTGKMAMFGGFFRNDAQKNRNFVGDVFKTHLQDQADTSHAVSELESFSKIYRVSRCGCRIAVLAAKNGEELFISRKFCLRFDLQFLEIFHPHFRRSDRTTGRGISKDWIFRVLRDFL